MSNARRGFTLIEVVISMGIITLALVPASNMWVASAEATSRTERLSEAMNLAQRTLETNFRNVPYSSQQATSGMDPQTGLDYSLTLSVETLGSPFVNHTLRKGEVVVTLHASLTPIVTLVALVAQEANQ